LLELRIAKKRISFDKEDIVIYQAAKNDFL